eukprot:scaffold244_cov172-Amphora_coffeaeformis.AAC.40
MKSFIFEFLCLLVAASARRSAPESPPRAFFPTGYPYGWGMPHPTLIDPPVEEPKEEKNVKEVKRGAYLGIWTTGYGRMMVRSQNKPKFLTIVTDLYQS